MNVSLDWNMPHTSSRIWELLIFQRTLLLIFNKDINISKYWASGGKNLSKHPFHALQYVVHCKKKFKHPCSNVKKWNIVCRALNKREKLGNYFGLCFSHDSMHPKCFIRGLFSPILVYTREPMHLASAVPGVKWLKRQPAHVVCAKRPFDHPQPLTHHSPFPHHLPSRN